MFCDMTKKKVEQRNLHSSIIVSIFQFYSIKHNSQSYCWIRVRFYQEFPGILFYIRLKFQVNQSFEKHHDTGQKMHYGFCYLLSFDLQTFYLEMILFLIMQIYSIANFGNFLNSTRRLRGNNYYKDFHAYLGELKSVLC